MTNLSIIERLSKQTDELIVPKKKPPYINYYYRNNNPGMVKYTGTGDYFVGSSGEKYNKYNSKSEGLAAIANTIKSISERLDTNSLDKIMKEYAQDDASGERFKKYESRLKNVFNIPNEINLEDDSQVKKLMMGITDIENPTLDKPDLNHNLYYFETDYDDALKLFKEAGE